MPHPVRVLKSRPQYDVALKRLSALMDHDLEPNSAEEAEFELLQLVIKAYEGERTTPPKVDPIQAIQFRMEQQGLTRKDLEPFIGSLPKVTEILARTRPLSLAMIKRLHIGLGLSAASLIADENLDDKALDESQSYEYDKFPLQEMSERGLFLNVQASASKLKARAEELVNGFLRTALNTSVTPALLRAPLHQSGARTMDDYALMVWRVCVIKKAHQFPPRGQYKPGLISGAWLRDLAKLSSFDRGPKLAHEFLSKHGICLVIEQHFKKTYLDGAAMLDGSMPIIALTLRHDRLDNFWFALLHEVIHVQKHLDIKRLFIADNLEDKSRAGVHEEEEADVGAQEALIPEKMWKSSAVRESHSTEDALELASQAGVHPCIVAGRIRHETGNWRLLSNLISGAGAVTPHFMEQIQCA